MTMSEAARQREECLQRDGRVGTVASRERLDTPHSLQLVEMTSLNRLLHHRGTRLHEGDLTVHSVHRNGLTSFAGEVGVKNGLTLLSCARWV